MSTERHKKTKHILLVDDDRLVLATLATNVSQAGYMVSSAKNADEADALLTGGCRPDLVLLDIRMPGLSGLHLAQRLREIDHIPFVILSAYSDEDTVQEALSQGALAFYAKPLEDAQLLLAIEAAIARGDELRGLRANREQLQTALDNERDINVAVGITMVQYRLKRKEAFEQLRLAARNRNVKLADIALEVLQTCETIAEGSKH